MYKQMQYFISVVETNSFTKAAEQCFISQSAISQQIRSLEQTIGVELLKRTHRTFTLSVAGEYFYQHSKEILKSVDELCKKTKEIEEEESVLKIGYLRGYAGKELNETIIEFSQLYPDVNVELIRGNHEELYDVIKTGKASLVVSDQRRAFSEDYINYHLLHVDCFVDLSINHPLAKKEFIEVDDLKDGTCILIASSNQQEIEQEFYENILGIKSKYIFVNDVQEAKLMVSINRGVLPIEKTHLFENTNNIITKPLYRYGKQLQRNYCAFWQKKYTNYYIEEFADMLRKNMRKSK